ncbi:MAG: hypothetical protein DRO11_09375 [Methanobacteriota archaeon]|nr:MAG: hypothetical protein DRO11_09375 [Euryarchaeota archaeon]
MIDKQKHRNEFRLRILLTNKCDKNCDNCLNDFQNKGSNFIDPYFTKKHIDEYVQLCKDKEIQPIISLSGGEPGLHKEFAKIYHFASRSGARVQINTNGLIDSHVFDSYGPDIRYHMGHELRNTVVPGQTAVIVVSESYSYEETKAFIKIFHDGGMKIKTFADYYSSENFRVTVYPKMLLKLSECFSLNGRHTGVQENRGSGCTGCNKDCVTLKALWLFPNNTSNYCPQMDKTVNISVEEAYYKHLVDNADSPMFSSLVWNGLSEFHQRD